MNELLSLLGWNSHFQETTGTSTEHHHVARVIHVTRDRYTIHDGNAEYQGLLPGKFYHDNLDIPITGDWVIIQPVDGEPMAIIQEVLPRLNTISRKAPGKQVREQAMVANIDILFIAQDINNLNVRSLERYLALAEGNNIKPVILLNKSDLCQDIKQHLDKIHPSAGHTPVHAVSAHTGSGLDDVTAYLSTGTTGMVAGPSGVGKSSIVNYLLSDTVQEVTPIREQDRRGRHTTTSRQMFFLPGGGLLIDTPGMRELHLWDDEGIDSAFSDISDLADNCRFRDCSHVSEPGCAVIQALKEGVISESRYESYHKLRREMDFLRSRTDMDAFLDRKQKDKELHREIKRIKKTLPRYRDK